MRSILVSSDLRRPRRLPGGSHPRCRRIYRGESFKAKGKRISTFEVETINELEPNRFVPSENASESDDTEGNEEGNDTDDGQSTTDIIDEITGQMKLFDE
mgnify:CR=1 FL=1